jgi:hypothetical protein
LVSALAGQSSLVGFKKMTTPAISASHAPAGKRNPNSDAPVFPTVEAIKMAVPIQRADNSNAQLIINDAPNM